MQSPPAERQTPQAGGCPVRPSLSRYVGGSPLTSPSGGIAHTAQSPYAVTNPAPWTGPFRSSGCKAVSWSSLPDCFGQLLNWKGLCLGKKMLMIEFSAEKKGDQKAYARWDDTYAEKHWKLKCKKSNNGIIKIRVLFLFSQFNTDWLHHCFGKILL